MELNETEITLTLPKHPEVEKLMEICKNKNDLIHALNTRLEYYENIVKDMIGGMLFTKDLRDLLLTVYPNEKESIITPTANSVVRCYVQNGVNDVARIANMKYDTAWCCGMRWPWSHEGHIDDNIDYE